MKISYAGQTNIHERSGSDQNLLFLKEVLTRLPLPEVTLPILGQEEAKLLEQIKSLYLERINRAEAGLKGRVTLNTLKTFVEQVFNVFIVLSEADCFYRDAIMDLIVIVCALHDEQRKRKGDDYLKDYLAVRTANRKAHLKLLEGK